MLRTPIALAIGILGVGVLVLSYIIRPSESAPVQDAPGNQRQASASFGKQDFASSANAVTGPLVTTENQQPLVSPSAPGGPKYDISGFLAIKAVEESFDAALLRLQRLFQDGRIREGYELCLAFIKGPSDSVPAHVRRVVGLRALPVFCPPDSTRRRDAYTLLVSTLKDSSTDINSRKESVCALVGLASLSLSVKPEESEYPLSVLVPAEAFSAGTVDTFLSEYIHGSSLLDLVTADPELVGWINKQATSFTPTEITNPRDPNYHLRQACIVALGALDTPNARKALYDLAQQEPDETFRVEAVATLLANPTTLRQDGGKLLDELTGSSQPPRVALLLAEAVQRHEKRFSSRISAVIDRLVDVSDKYQEGGLYARNAYHEALRMTSFYCSLSSTTADQRLALRPRLQALIRIGYQWDSLPSSLEHVLSVKDPVIRVELKSLIEASPDGEVKRSLLGKLERGR